MSKPTTPVKIRSPRRVVQVSFSKMLGHSSRIEKEVDSLLQLELFDSAKIIGGWAPNLSVRENLTDKVEVVRIRTTVQRLWASGWLLRPLVVRKIAALFSILHFQTLVLLELLKSKGHSIVCRHVDLLPVSAIAKVLTRASLVYSPHELESHKTGLSQPGQAVAHLLERVFLRFVDETVVVSEPIARWYVEKFGLSRVHLVPNIPNHPVRGQLFERTSLFRDYFSIPENHLIFLYQGLVSRGRGIEDLLEVFQKAPDDRHLVVMGYGDLSDTIRQAGQDCTRIHFKEAVAVNEILAWTSSADVGVFFNSSHMTLSYEYSLPNKFFEYAIGGLFILVSNNFSEQARYVQKYQLGVSINPSKSDLLNTVCTLSHEKISSNALQSSEFRKTISWQSLNLTFLDVYLSKDIESMLKSLQLHD